MQLNPCNPCCTPSKLYCHPRICYRFVDAWTGSPVNVSVLKPTCSQGWRISGSGSNWCLDAASGDCSNAYRLVTLDSSGNPQPTGNFPNSAYSMCQGIFAQVVWDRGGGHTCSGWVTAPSSVCCASGDPVIPTLDWPLCCPQVCATVTTPQITGSFGVGTQAALVSDVVSDNMILLPPPVQLNYTTTDGGTTWKGGCDFPTLYTGKSSSGYADDSRFNTQADIKMVINPVTDYQQWGACGQTIHRVWGACNSFRYQPCGYNEVTLSMTEHGGTVVPWCLSGVVETCPDVPINAQNSDGTVLGSVNSPDVPSLVVTISNPADVTSKCGVFSGGTLSLDCTTYATSGFVWQGCLSFSGPNLKVRTCHPEFGSSCPVCNDCIDRLLQVTNAKLVVACTVNGLSVTWQYYFNSQCRECKSCTNGQVICDDNPNYTTINMIGYCSGNTSPLCANWLNWSTGSWYKSGSAGGACPSCPDCCYQFADGGGACLPACDPSITCDKCQPGSMYGPKFISYEPLLIEFRGCVSSGTPPVVTCGDLQGTITSG
jgi:hypothetical protein